MILETLVVRLDGNVSGFDEAISSAERRVTRFGGRMQGLGARMTLAITTPLLAAGAAAVSVGADFESLGLGLEAVTGSASEAERQLARLREIAKLPAVDLQQAAQTSIAFQAIGKDAEFAERMIRGVANAVALSGGGGEAFGGVMRQLRQVASLGRLMGEEMNVILENAPAMAKAIQSAFGTTSTEAIRKLGLTSEEFFERLMQGMEALPRVAGGARNSLDNLWQGIREGANTIGQVLLPVVMPAAEAFGAWAENLRNVNPALVRFAVALGGVVAALGPLLFMAGTLVTSLGAIATALSIGLAPLLAAGGVIIVGLTLLASKWLEVAKNAREAKRAQEDAAQQMRDQFAGMSPEARQAAIADARAEYDRQAARARRLRQIPGAEDNRVIQAQLRGIDEAAAQAWRRYLQLLSAQREVTQATTEQTTATVAYGRAVEDTAGNITRLLERQDQLREKIADTRFEQAFVTTADEAKQLTEELVAMQAELAKVEASLQRIAQGRLGGLPPVTPAVAQSLPLTPIGGTVRLSDAEQDRFRQTQRLPDVADWRGDLITAAEESEAATHRMRIGVVNNFGAMAEAAIWGSEQMEVSIVRGITNILASIPGVGGFAGAIIGTVGGIIGGLFGRSNRPQPVKVPEMPKAVKELEKINATLRNVDIKWVNLMRHQVARTFTPPAATTPPPPRERPAHPSFRIDQVVVQAAPGDKPEQLWGKFRTALQRAAAGGDPDAREILGTT